MTDRELMQMALDALSMAVEPKKGKVYAFDFQPIDCAAMHLKAIEALRAALAQPEQEPVAWKDAPSKIYLQVCEDVDCDLSFEAHDEVSWCQDKINDGDIPYIRADTAPPQREWVGLTDEEVADLGLFHAVVDAECVRAIEAKIKEKNT